MKKVTILLAASILAIAGCGSNGRNNGRDNATADNPATEEDFVECGRTGYADIVSFIVQGFQAGWEGMSPEDQGLSPVYSYSSPCAGFTEKDLNGDGIPELLIGDQFENGSVNLYDVYTINPSDGSLIHLVKGGERDWYSVNGDGVLIEHASNSAFESYEKAFTIMDGKLNKVKADAWHETALILDLQNFARTAEEAAN